MTWALLFLPLAAIAGSSVAVSRPRERPRANDPVVDVEPGDVRVLERAAPQFPPGDWSRADLRCTSHVVVAPDGEPEEVEVDDCPAAIREATRIALMKWRWEPPVVDGPPARVRVTVDATEGVPHCEVRLTSDEDGTPRSMSLGECDPSMVEPMLRSAERGGYEVITPRPPAPAAQACPIAPAGSPIAEMHHSELEVLSRTPPRYPIGADGPDQRCVALVVVGPDGAPQGVEVSGCDAPFHASTCEALMAWRWTPPRAEGEPVRARIQVAVSYRRR